MFAKLKALLRKAAAPYDRCSMVGDRHAAQALHARRVRTLVCAIVATANQDESALDNRSLGYHIIPVIQRDIRMSANGRNDVRLIKKYPNRRLYDTRTSCHITLADIRQLVISEEPFQVVDAKTGEDLTRSILLQIIQEAESDGEPIFSSETLKGIIRFYGPFQGVLASYLEKSIQSVIDVQTQAGVQSTQAWTDFMQSQAPMMQDLMRQYVEQSKKLYLNTQNMFGIFSGFAGNAGGKKDGDESQD